MERMKPLVQGVSKKHLIKGARIRGSLVRALQEKVDVMKVVGNESHAPLIEKYEFAIARMREEPSAWWFCDQRGKPPMVVAEEIWLTEAHARATMASERTHILADANDSST